MREDLKKNSTGWGRENGCARSDSASDGASASNEENDVQATEKGGAGDWEELESCYNKGNVCE